jgi:hypothetical protein
MSGPSAPAHRCSSTPALQRSSTPALGRPVQAESWRFRRSHACEYVVVRPNGIQRCRPQLRGTLSVGAARSVAAAGMRCEREVEHVRYANALRVPVVADGAQRQLLLARCASRCSRIAAAVARALRHSRLAQVIACIRGSHATALGGRALRHSRLALRNSASSRARQRWGLLSGACARGSGSAVSCRASEVDEP